jgi:hypothetical protein
LTRGDRTGGSGPAFVYAIIAWRGGEKWGDNGRRCNLPFQTAPRSIRIDDNERKISGGID